MSVFGKYGFAYRCSICREVIAVDDVRSHLEKEKSKGTWPGAVSMDRVDPPDPEAKE